MRASFIRALCVLSAAGCAVAFAQSAKSISFADATSYENALVVKDRPSIERPKMLYSQPVNKKVPCKLPTSEDQLARNNFRSYWDGQCKNGYAFGLGRDIAISDTHHVEEITIHNGTSDHDSNQSSVYFDFVNGFVAYQVSGEKYPAHVSFTEYIKHSLYDLKLDYVVRKVDEDGKESTNMYSPFRFERVYGNINGGVGYKFTEHMFPYLVDTSVPTFVAEVIDPKTGNAGGVSVVRFGKYQLKHFLVEGTQKSPVTAPDEYVNHLREKLAEVTSAVSTVNVESARKMEREYLYFACNGKHSISGLDKNISSKICTWRDQFKTPYKNAENKFKQELERLQQKAELAEEQKRSQEQQQARYRQLAEERQAAQQQLAAQQEALNRRQEQQEMRELGNAIGQWGQQMQFAGQQMLQSVQMQRAPQLMPFEPLGGNRINCVTVSNVTNCR
jgi:flagellar biosynthesis GTPase FlhF